MNIINGSECLSFDSVIQHLMDWRYDILELFRDKSHSILDIIGDTHCGGEHKCIKCRFMKRYFYDQSIFKVTCGSHKGESFVASDKEVEVISYRMGDLLLCNSDLIDILAVNCLGLHSYEFTFKYICGDRLKTIDLQKNWRSFDQLQSHGDLIREIPEPTVAKSTSDARIPLKVSTVTSILVILKGQFRVLDQIWLGSISVSSLLFNVFEKVSVVKIAKASVESRIDVRLIVPSDSSFSYIRSFDPNVSYVSSSNIGHVISITGGYFKVISPNDILLMTKGGKINSVIAKRWSFVCIFTALMSEHPFINTVLSDKQLSDEWNNLFHIDDRVLVTERVIKASKRDSYDSLKYKEICNILKDIRIKNE